MKYVALISTFLLVATLQLTQGNEWGGRCQCSNGGRRSTCGYNSSSYQVGCGGTNQYLQCNNNICSNQTCPTNQVWNSTQGACAACATGYQLSNNSQHCVCARGTSTQYNFFNESCIACPTNSVVQQYSCSCSNTTVFDPNTYACRACPVSSVMEGQFCKCVNGTFWNAGAWQCQACPGTLSNVTDGSRYGNQRTKQICTCNGTNQIFYAQNVTCLTCPTSITTVQPKGKFQGCVCNIRGQYFNYTTSLCQCGGGVSLNANGTACQYSNGRSDGAQGQPVQGWDSEDDDK